MHSAYAGCGTTARLHGVCRAAAGIADNSKQCKNANCHCTGAPGCSIHKARPPNMLYKELEGQRSTQANNAAATSPRCGD